MNPFKPDNHTQILKTDLHAFPSRFSREDSIEEESIFPLVTKVLFILTIVSLDDELLLSGENQYVYFWLLNFCFIILVWGPLVIQLKYCPVLPSLNKVD